MKDGKTQQLAAVLRHAREKSGLSMAEAASGLELTVATLSRIENGLIGTKADRVAQMAELYGLSVADLLEGRVVNGASKIDLETLHAVVRLVQEVIADLGASPSPDKIADVVQSTFQDELETGRLNLDSLAERHRAKLKLMLKP